MNINLTLIRHGESIANVDNSVYYKIPDNKIPLSPTGLEQAVSLGLEFKKQLISDVKIIHSPFERTTQTAKAIASSLDSPILIEDPLIYEISLMHSFEEMKTTIDFFNESKKDYGFYWYKEGTSESYADVYQRARIFAQDLKLNKYNFKEDDTVFIVSHGVFLMLLIAVLNNLPVKDAEKLLWLGNCKTYSQTFNVFDLA